jgi:hypothetical protein
MLRPLVRMSALGAALFATSLVTPAKSSALPTCPLSCSRAEINCEGHDRDVVCWANGPYGPNGQCMSSTEGILDVYQIFCSCMTSSATGGGYYVNCVDP